MAIDTATKASPYGDGYKWPDNLYREMRDMVTMSMLVYDFGYVIDAARQAKEEGRPFVGLKVENDTIEKSEVDNSVLKRCFTPAEVKNLIQDNIDYLKEKDYGGTFVSPHIDILFTALDDMQERADEYPDMERPLVIEEYDDKYQKQECVYGITRDSTNKRIVVVFRGTDMQLAPISNWKSNISIFKTNAEVPDILKGKLSEDSINLHTGFYKYLHNESKSVSGVHETKYNQVKGDIKELLKRYPDHKIYVTGHSLGGALSGLCSFYLASEPDLPKPISCINFASPRFGGYRYYEGSQYLEKMKQLRMLRGVNDNDTVASAPSWGYYHGGFCCTLEKNGYIFSAGPPKIEYRKMNSMWSKLTNDVSQSFFTSLNLGFDHGIGDYLARIKLAKPHLKKMDLNSLYMDENRVGYKLEDDPCLYL